MRKVETLMGVVMIVIALLLGGTVALLIAKQNAKPTPDPSGIWAGLVDDLPSGRLVECVFARDPSGSVAVTCDWNNAVVRGRP